MGMTGFQAFEGCHRRGADDSPEVLFHHDGKDSPAAIKGSPEGGVDHEVPDLIGDINDLRWPVCSRIIEENVYFPESFHRFANGFFDIMPVCDVTLHGEGINAEFTFYFIYHGTAAFEVHIGDDHLGAFPGEPTGSSLPYTGTGSGGAKGYSVFQFHDVTSRDILPKSGGRKQEEKEGHSCK
jgi:hypothetical protein